MRIPAALILLAVLAGCSTDSVAPSPTKTESPQFVTQIPKVDEMTAWQYIQFASSVDKNPCSDLKLNRIERCDYLRKPRRLKEFWHVERCGEPAVYAVEYDASGDNPLLMTSKLKWYRAAESHDGKATASLTGFIDRDHEFFAWQQQGDAGDFSHPETESEFTINAGQRAIEVAYRGPSGEKAMTAGPVSLTFTAEPSGRYRIEGEVSGEKVSFRIRDLSSRRVVATTVPVEASAYDTTVRLEKLEKLK